MMDSQGPTAAELARDTAQSIKAFTRRPHRTYLLLARDGRVLAALGVWSMALVLEVIPVAGVMVILAAWVQGQAALTLPVWWLLASELVAYGVGSVRLAPLLAARRPFMRHLAWTIAALMVLATWAATLLGPVIFSPSDHGHLPLAVAAVALIRELHTGNLNLHTTVAFLGVASLTTYLWWRGLVLSRRQFTREHLFATFRTGLMVLVAAIFVAQPLRVSERDQVNAVLAFFLPSQVVAGLIGTSLAHLTDAARARQERQLDTPPHKCGRFSGYVCPSGLR